MSEPDFEIELLDAETQAEESILLPRNFLTLGQIEPEDVKVYIHQRVYKALEKLAASDTSKELGSILIGDYAREMGSVQVVITDYIEAKYTDASAATLTFTHETWDYVHAEHARRFPDKKIVGWQHTHPSYGIFLSNYDLFIQENFFDLPFQIAYVIDPVQQLRGFFQWKNGKTVKLHGYYVFDETGKEIRLEKPQKKEKKPKKTALLTTLVAVLGAACLGLGIFSAVLLRQLNQSAALLAACRQQLTGVMGQLEEKDTTISRQQDKIGQLETAVNEKPETPTEPENTVTFRFLEYTVQEGDSLEAICADLGIDYAQNARLILGINGISDPNRIYPGQTILLPAA